MSEYISIRDTGFLYQFEIRLQIPANKAAAVLTEAFNLDFNPIYVIIEETFYVFGTEICQRSFTVVILHIAHVTEYMFFGVNVSVPQHIIAQQQTETVAFINTAGVMLDGIDKQIQYTEPFSFESLPKPFDKPDLIVFHEVYQRKLLSIFSLAMKKKLPYVIIPHGCLTNAAQNKKHLKKLAGNFLVYNRIIRGAKGLQCLSEREMDETVFDNYKFIGTNGVNVKKAEKSFSSDGVNFLYIGRLDIEIKGFDILIGAISKCKKFLYENNCHFSAYGPNDDRSFEQIQKMIVQNGVGNLIKLHGPIIGEKKAEKLRQADCFIQCSRTEGMSMGILEALATGLPCILTKGTGVSETVYDSRAGWKCENTVSSVADAIQEAVKNKAVFPEYSENAVRLAEENYTWSKVAGDAISEYKKLIKQ